MICPHCNEVIKDDATKCKHCKEWISETNNVEQITTQQEQQEQINEINKNKFNENRYSVREILSNEFWQYENDNPPLSLKDYGKIAANVGLLSLATLASGSAAIPLVLIVSASSKIGSKMGINSKKTVERSYAFDYKHAVLLLALTLHDSGKNIVGIEDTENGCEIQADIKADWKTFGGTLHFNIIDNLSNETLIVGKSIIKGQLIDWGKGKSTLNEIFDKLSAFN